MPNPHCTHTRTNAQPSATCPQCSAEAERRASVTRAVAGQAPPFLERRGWTKQGDGKAAVWQYRLGCDLRGFVHKQRGSASYIATAWPTQGKLSTPSLREAQEWVEGEARR